MASAILFVTRSESSFPVVIKAFHYLDVPWFIVLTLPLALRSFRATDCCSRSVVFEDKSSERKECLFVIIYSLERDSKKFYNYDG